MSAFDLYAGLTLRGGLLLKAVRSEHMPIKDALGRPALARTTITGTKLEVEVDAGLSAEDFSVTLYHEVLEAAALAVAHPPAMVCELNEAGFESAAWQMHGDLGPSTPATLNRMLELFGF